MIDKQAKPRGKGVRVTFSIPVEWLDRPVSVVGEFNGWDPLVNPMRKRNGVRTVSVVLEPGQRYRFRYLDDRGWWHDDPAADDVAANTWGGWDCVVDLTGAAEE